MKKLVVFTLLALAFAPVLGNAASTADSSRRAARISEPVPHARKARPHPTVTPTPTPAPVVEKKHSWLYRLFHPKPKPTPAPVIAAPTPTPSPTPVKKSRKRTKTVAPKPARTETSAEPAETVSTPTPTPVPKKSRTKKPDNPDTANGLTEPVPFVPDGMSPGKTARPANSGAPDSAHFRELKARALEDKQVQELQNKADSAPEGDEQRQASENYYRALFKKMRELDPSFKDRIDRTEAATLRRL